MYSINSPEKIVKLLGTNCPLRRCCLAPCLPEPKPLVAIFCQVVEAILGNFPLLAKLSNLGGGEVTQPMNHMMSLTTCEILHPSWSSKPYNILIAPWYPDSLRQKPGWSSSFWRCCHAKVLSSDPGTRWCRWTTHQFCDHKGKLGDGVHHNWQRYSVLEVHIHMFFLNVFTTSIKNRIFHALHVYDSKNIEVWGRNCSLCL